MKTRELQAALKKVGLYDGEVDDKWGGLSQNAFDRLLAGYVRCASSQPDKLAPTQAGWVWDQSEGALYRDGVRIATGYSGKGPGRNNPAMEKAVGVGPLPAGDWTIGAPRTSAKTGPHVMDLTPIGHAAHGRSAFQIHGDNATGTASSGCIILPRAIREKISASGDRRLRVVP